MKVQSEICKLYDGKVCECHAGDLYDRSISNIYFDKITRMLDGNYIGIHSFSVRSLTRIIRKFTNYTHMIIQMNSYTKKI